MKTKKKVIRLTESDLHNIVRKTVNRLLRENMESREEITVEKIPCWALFYLINGDSTNLDDAEIQEIENWLRSSGITEVTPPDDDEGYFTRYPAFGSPCEVMDCKCFYRL